MRRVPHVLKRNECSRGFPEHVLAYDTETRGQPTPERPSVAVELKWGHAIWCRLSRGTREARDFTTQDEFWDFVEQRAKPHERLWVIAHNAKNFDLAVLEWEEQLTRRGWKISGTPIIPMEPGPLKVVARKDRWRTIILCDLANWYGPQSLEAIGAAVGCPKQTFPSEEQKQAVLRAEAGDPLWDTLTAYGRQDVEVVLRALQVLIDFCREHDLGNWSVSIAGQAMQAFRHRFMDTEVFLHTDQAALELEREAYLGARVDCFRIGSWGPPGGPYAVVDVNSEYPHVMSEQAYPVRLLEVRRRPPLEWVTDQLANPERALCARVEIDTDRRCDLEPRQVAQIPIVHEGKLIYPIGHFVATLCTGELARAIKLGIVVRVLRAALYQAAALFRGFVEFFWGLRRQYQAAGNVVWVALCKLFMNSLYGKFGQRNFEWTETRAALERPGVEKVQMLDGSIRTYRQYVDRCEVRAPEKTEGYSSFCAIAAHATSWARLCISDHRATAGLDNVLYMDTDSLIVDPAGLTNLERKGLIGSDLGQLKVEEVAPEVTITAPKNYRCGAKVRHKGRRRDAEALGDGYYRQVQFRSLAGAFRARDPNRAVLSLVVKRADLPYSKGVVGPDGWTTPFHLDLMVRLEPT